jgi:predicted O-methyltransferase YrrM
MLTGGRVGVPQLVDFVVGNRFFVAMQVRDELIALGEILACQCPERALEIGTAEGGTLFFLSRLASPRATILSVDLPGGQFGGGYDALRAWCYRRFARSRQRLTLLQGDSHTNEMLNRVKAALRGQTLDYLFIDGDHTYEGVKRDFELYGPLVRKGGIIALHDIADHPTPLGCEVSRFWNEVKPQRPHIELVADRGQRWAGIGVLNVE